MILDLGLLLGWFAAVSFYTNIERSHAATFVLDRMVAEVTQDARGIPVNCDFEYPDVFSAHQHVEERQLAIFFFLDRELDVGEDRVQIRCEIPNVVSTNDDKRVINIPNPQSWSIMFESQCLQSLARLSNLSHPFFCSPFTWEFIILYHQL
ncbi:unnamed protein product [Dibothriocephalus latus]|uniref:ZP domain-containing protein n=1 Tax=Dibothriocephalus latus TaxID=60516 RepID=A0A3P7N8E6_DIBLA|nr:unnamed protein product [Dibothriocephalus latus]